VPQTRSTSASWASITVVDGRSRVAVVAGQEILSADSVPLRLSVTLRYRVERPETALETAVSFADTLHAETQLVLRDLVAAVPGEALLPQRQRLLEGNPALVTLRTLDAAASARGTIVLGVSPALAAAAEPPRRPERE
jgi:regulator of protease activity HflC (stomatin/prohibitin superfamily)